MLSHFFSDSRLVAAWPASRKPMIFIELSYYDLPGRLESSVMTRQPFNFDPDQATAQILLDRPRFIMMSGTYCAGKSTWTDQYLKRITGDKPMVISFDAIVQEQAAALRLSSHELMQLPAQYAACTELMMERLNSALTRGQSLVLDNTNTTSAWRSQILAGVAAAPHDYYKIAVCLPITLEEGEARFHARNAAMTGLEEEQKKPVAHFHAHYRTYTSQPQPSLEEGFDLVVKAPTGAYRAQQWTQRATQSETQSPTR